VYFGCAPLRPEGRVMTLQVDSTTSSGTAPSRAEIRRRSLAGIFYLTSSSGVNLFVGFLSSLALARMLRPQDLGVVAIGSTAILIGGALADGGIGAGMIRRAEPPRRDELRTLNGIQLALALFFCVPAASVALAFGRTGAVTAIMLASIPITLLAAPGRIVLTRDLRYDRTTAIDLGSQVVFNVFAVVTVFLGAGVWGLAVAAVVKAVVGTTLTALLGRVLAIPTLRGWRGQIPLVRFGLKFQASWFTWIAREQSLNILVGVIGGFASLGVWTLTNRIFQLPSIAFSSLYAVGFPAMSSLLARGEDPRPIILRTVRRAALVGTFVFIPFAAASPRLIPAVFGDQWQTAAGIMPFICLSTLMLGSIAVAAHSYLAAAGRPGVTAWASAALGVVWLGVTAALLPALGVVAIGIGNLVGALVESFILDRATHRMAGVRPYRPLVLPLAVATITGAVGWALCASGPDGLWFGLAAAAATAALSFAGLWLVCRDDLMDVIRLAGSTLRGILPEQRKTSLEGA
jgi:O-antigen/teichoic acid export membrane protein